MLKLYKYANLLNIQGHSQQLSKSKSLLVPKYESETLPEPTEGSTDVIHLIKYDSCDFLRFKQYYRRESITWDKTLRASHNKAKNPINLGPK